MKREQGQLSFTDVEARMMKMVDGSYYAHNAPAVADEYSQVIVTVHVHQMIPMISAAIVNPDEAGIEGEPKVTLAEARCGSEDSLQRPWGRPCPDATSDGGCQ